MSTTATFDLATFDVDRYHSLVDRGLSKGLGDRDGRICIEAVICDVIGLPHGDDPQCVTASVRSFKIALNDSNWSSPAARAAGLRDLGLAQLGSLGVVKDEDFVRLMALRTTTVLLAQLLREIFPNDAKILAIADRCEAAPSLEEAARAAEAARAEAAEAARAAAEAARAARAAEAARAEAAEAARAAAEAAWAARVADKDPDKYLLLSARIALDVLRELKSPGCALLEVSAA